MLAETTISKAPSEAPQRWGRVLGEGFAIQMVAGVAGLLGGAFLLIVLGRWLVGPEIFTHLDDIYPGLPPHLQALFSKDGLTLCGNLFYVPLGILVLWQLVPRTGRPVREYLGLAWPGLREGLSWGLLILAVDYGYNALVVWLDLPLSGKTLFEDIARFPVFLPLLLLSTVVLVPVFEELFFRGFLLEGLRQSQLGETGAILLTSSIWAVMHSGGPYRWLGLVLYGALLARARLRTGSIYLPMVLHGIGNLVSVLLLASR